MTGSERLGNARTLVERGWCQGAEARDSRGQAIPAVSPDATAWSLLGALQAITAGDRTTELQDVGDAVAALAELILDPSLANWNDSEARTKLEVLSALKDAELLMLGQLVYHEYSDN